MLLLIYFGLIMDRVLLHNSNCDFNLFKSEKEVIADPGSLIPSEVDDEFIIRTAILRQPKGSLALLVGFSAIVRLHCSLEFSRLAWEGPVFRATARCQEPVNYGPVHAAQTHERINVLTYRFSPELLLQNYDSETCLELEQVEIPLDQHARSSIRLTSPY